MGNPVSNIRKAGRSSAWNMSRRCAYAGRGGPDGLPARHPSSARGRRAARLRSAERGTPPGCATPRAFWGAGAGRRGTLQGVSCICAHAYLDYADRTCIPGVCACIPGVHVCITGDVYPSPGIQARTPGIPCMLAPGALSLTDWAVLARTRCR